MITCLIPSANIIYNKTVHILMAQKKSESRKSAEFDLKKELIKMRNKAAKNPTKYMHVIQILDALIDLASE